MTSVRIKRWAENSIRRFRGSPRSRTLPPQRARSVSSAGTGGHHKLDRNRFRGSLPARAHSCVYRVRHEGK